MPIPAGVNADFLGIIYQYFNLCWHFHHLSVHRFIPYLLFALLIILRTIDFCYRVIANNVFLDTPIHQ
jgi:hypothetical protein